MAVAAPAEERLFGRFPYGSNKPAYYGQEQAGVVAGDVQTGEAEEGEEEDEYELAPAPGMPYSLHVAGDSADLDRETGDALAQAAGSRKVAGGTSSAVIVEPWMRRPAVEFCCIVIQGESE